MLTTIYILLSLLVGTLFGCMRLYERVIEAEREVDRLMKLGFEYESELFYLKKGKP